MVVLGAAAILVPLVLGLRACFGSDAAKIRALVEDAAEALNRRAIRDVLSPFHASFRDATSGLGRGEIETALFTLRGSSPEEAGAFRVIVDSVAVTLDPEAQDEAGVAAGLRFVEGPPEDAVTVWEVRVVAEARRIDGSWQFVKSTHETLRGRPPR